MTTSSQTEAREGQRASFEFNCGEEGFRLSADFGQLFEQVGEQLRTAMASFDFDGLRREFDEAMQNAAQDLRRASTARPQKSQRGPTRVHVDIRTEESKGQSRRAPQSEPGSEERLLILSMIAEGKITPEEGAKLLEALAT